jgi:osmoprotectant transport system ATP-binding protein
MILALESRHPEERSDRTEPAAVEFRSVSKSYAPGRSVLVDLSLRVEAGETVALLGPSGCGKTTALKLVNRLLAPESGTVFVFGRDVQAEDAVGLRRRTGWVIQETGLFPHWSVRENVEAVPRLLGWEAARRRDRAAELLAMVGLPEAEWGGRRPRELSGGQRQRVGVARALAADPPLLLMDEPFGALDPIARRSLQREFLGWKRGLGKAVLLVTHDVREALLLSDRVAVMKEGRLRQLGTPEEIRTRPADAFVREFVGEALT